MCSVRFACFLSSLFFRQDVPISTLEAGGVRLRSALDAGLISESIKYRQPPRTRCDGAVHKCPKLQDVATRNSSAVT